VKTGKETIAKSMCLLMDIKIYYLSGSKLLTAENPTRILSRVWIFLTWLIVVGHKVEGMGLEELK